MKWLLMIFLAVLTLPCTVHTAHAQFRYTIAEGEVTITGYGGPGGDVVIPSMIEELPVTAIEAPAFILITSLTRITIPDSVTSIVDFAFSGCTSLTAINVDLLNPSYSSLDGVLFDKDQTTLIKCPEGKVGSFTIPEFVTTINGGAFNDCKSLTAIEVDPLNPFFSSLEGVLFNKDQTTLMQCPGGKVGSYTIPDSVIRIGDFAFSHCTRLTNVAMPDSVTSIGQRAFIRCAGITTITIPDNVISVGEYAFTWCTNLAGVMVGSSVTIIGDWAFASCANLTKITIPDSLASIGKGTFYYCTSLTNVMIGNSVTNIGGSAFKGCTSLTSVIIPNKVISIGEEAFFRCTGLVSVTIGNSVISLESSAFQDCRSLSDVVLGNSVNDIGDDAFRECTNLTSVTIPDNVTRIGVNVFTDCTSLTNVTIGNSVTSMGGGAFSGCTSLTSIDVASLNPVYSSLDGVLFNKTHTVLLECPEGKSGDYSIPNSVTRIKSFAFYGCSSLISITIPDRVTIVESDAFSECRSLTSVYFKGNAPYLHPWAFWHTWSTLYYLPGTTGWWESKDGRPTAFWVLPHPIILDFGSSFGVISNKFSFIISWAASANVVVETTSNLTTPDWLPISTNTLVDGVSSFIDPEWTNHTSRFYRLRWE